MSQSATNPSDGLSTFTIKTNGKNIDDAIQVFSIEVEKGVNRIPIAKVTVLDGSAAEESFDVSSSSTFIPGASIEIEAGYDSRNQVIFKGIITKQRIRFDNTMGPVLEVECRDEAVKMMVGRKSRTYCNKKDSDIISGIISSYSGLSAAVKATTTVWPGQVQYYATDWDFSLARAEANGMIVNVLNGIVSVLDPTEQTSSILQITYGDNLFAFDATLDAVTQLGSAQASSWDIPSQKTRTGVATSTYPGPGNLSSQKLSEVVGLANFELQSTAPIQKADLENWSKATLTKSAYSKIQGIVKFQGSSLVEPAKYITLAGVGDRFNGDHFTSFVHHTIADGNWITEASIGMSPSWSTQEPSVTAPTASGLLPGVQGLFNATVKKIFEDPDSQYRVLIDLPLFDPKGEGIWARLTNFYASSGAGVFFMPEVGDEVVVGFLNEDPRYPIILGSMYSAENNKPVEGLRPDEKNAIKSIATKSGISITFDDENKILTLETPNNNRAIFSDQDKEITIIDQNNNRITMSEIGITLSNDKDIIIESGQKLTLKGNQGVAIESSGGDVEIKGMNITESAEIKYSAEGNATASLKGGAQTTIQGAMVMIN
ncbi:type VI secretion system tip protein VgrG [Algoriphagus yeomjeoni]|uniref:type VI secretion system tip protein VgrG n=1 Tax=Algoriphagus yeomjeoni TaxID=291403 RepID=UPI003CE57AB1